MAQRAGDQYPTPKLLANVITDWALRLHPLAPQPRILIDVPDVGQRLSVLEPGAGWGAPFLQAAVARLGGAVECAGVELEDVPQPLPGISWRAGRDFLQPINFPHPFDLVITNPPFSLAEQFVARAHEVVHPWGLIVFLLQMGFKGAKDRIEFWARYRPFAQRTIRPRPGFVKSTTSGASRDMRDYIAVAWPGPALARFLANIRRDWCEDGFLDCPHPKGWGRAEE